MKRYPEIDLLRSLAIAMMITYHIAYDLAMFYDWDFDPFSGNWKILWQSTAILFLLLVGISFAISWERQRASQRVHTWTQRYKKYVVRGLGIVSCGMLVTVVTYLWEPSTYVRFGILHLIGASILLLPFFARLKELNVILGAIIIAFGSWMVTMRVETSLLLPLGWMYREFMSVDYFPVFPWFGWVLIGYATGHLLYVRWTQWRSLFSFHFPLFTPLTFPGRHALMIYLLHQPVILGIFRFLKGLGFL